MVPQPCGGQRCSSNAGGSSTTSAGPIARIAINLLPRSVEPGWIPIISTRDSLPDWLQNSTAGHQSHVELFEDRCPFNGLHVGPDTSEQLRPLGVKFHVVSRTVIPA